MVRGWEPCMQSQNCESVGCRRKPVGLESRMREGEWLEMIWGCRPSGLIKDSEEK